jgi:hypothetical protein
MRNRWLAPAGLAAATLVIAGCGSSGGSASSGSAPSSAAAAPASSAASSGTALKTAKIGGATVLTSARGLHVVLIRPGHPDQLQVQWLLRHVLAAG